MRAIYSVDFLIGRGSSLGILYNLKQLDSATAATNEEPHASMR